MAVVMTAGGATEAGGAAATELEEAMAPLLIKVTHVKKCEGAASVQSSAAESVAATAEATVRGSVAALAPWLAEAWAAG